MDYKTCKKLDLSITCVAKGRGTIGSAQKLSSAQEITIFSHKWIEALLKMSVDLAATLKN